ncbi:MAG: rRNA maturation RNase YbeY [Desulfobacteraceae bacterium]|nr:MAG: rRNA maturation RNase YbeY [Desulfobacteraceae bacterium]
METLSNALGCPDKELSILFTGDDHMTELNGRYMGREGPTNVLAFPMDDGSGLEPATGMLGDIVISLDTAKREAESAGETFDETLDRLLIHGFLHLMGFDHERSKEDAIIMEKEERRLLKMIGEEIKDGPSGGQC